MICLAGVHGNEMSGIKALDLIFKMLEVEPITNPSFQFKGRLVGFLGNLKALQAGRRFVSEDMNRIWTEEIINHIMHTPEAELENEQLELRQLLRAVELEIDDYQPDHVVLLDLHSTSSPGGIFTIVRNDLESIRFGIELHAPVILGLIEGLQGTLLHYFNPDHFERKLSSIVFEAGHHKDPLSVNRSIAAVINCLRTAEMVRAEHVENQHDLLLIEHSRDLPKVNHLIYIHHCDPNDGFVMIPGFKNFDRVVEGMLLAHDHQGEIRAKCDGLLLMPRYQSEGGDGFFIIEKNTSPEIAELVEELEIHFSCKIEWKE